MTSSCRPAKRPDDIIFRDDAIPQKGCCQISRNGSVTPGSRGNLGPSCVENRDGVNGANLACFNELLPRGSGRVHENHQILTVEAKRGWRGIDTFAKTYAKRSVNTDREVPGQPFIDVRRGIVPGLHYISSSPRSVRARSMTAGVISEIPRSIAHSA